MGRLTPGAIPLGRTTFRSETVMSEPPLPVRSCHQIFGFLGEARLKLQGLAEVLSGPVPVAQTMPDKPPVVIAIPVVGEQLDQLGAEPFAVLVHVVQVIALGNPAERV